MNLRHLFEQIRDYYVTRLLDAANEQLTVPGRRVLLEYAFRDSNGELATDGTLELPLRGDLMVLSNDATPDPVLVDTEGMLSFAPITFVLPDASLDVEIGPFQWNWLGARIYGLPSHPDWAPLRAWYLGWFGESDPPEHELLGGVHFLSDPVLQSDHWEIYTDLGTASVDVIDDLLNVLTALGASRVVVGQSVDPADGGFR